jgi:hypothetical protein
MFKRITVFDHLGATIRRTTKHYEGSFEFRRGDRLCVAESKHLIWTLPEWARPGCPKGNTQFNLTLDGALYSLVEAGATHGPRFLQSHRRLTFKEPQALPSKGNIILYRNHSVLFCTRGRPPGQRWAYGNIIWRMANMVGQRKWVPSRTNKAVPCTSRYFPNIFLTTI